MAEITTATEAAPLPFIETNCTITGPNGNTFESGGAQITPDHCIAYVGAKLCHNRYNLTDWHGNIIGKITITATWPLRNCLYSDTMSQAIATVDGATYTGRTAGPGMIFRGKRKKSEAKA
jgi:hypothetical protein